MSDSCEYSSVSDYNTAKILYCVFCNTYNAQVKRAGDNTLFLGKTDVGNYELSLDKNMNLQSLSVPDASLKIKFIKQ